MNESLLHFIWKFRLFNAGNLKTAQGEPIEVVKPGVHNTHSGADFQNAKVRIGKVLWAGNVEIHLQSSAWNAHKHNSDAAYDNVILHVVYENDGDIKKKNGETIPTLELKDRISPALLSRYNELAKRKYSIPCEKHFPAEDTNTINSYLQRLMVERLEEKVEVVQSLLAENGNDWENLMFAMVAKYFGASINKEPFYLLARLLPLNIWAKYAGDSLQVEALVFGQAGFLEEKFNDEYPSALRKEYMYLKRLHNLQPLDKHLWKFLRLRPSNFPTIRLAQLAAFLCSDTKIFSKILNRHSVKSTMALFDVQPAPYWKTHFHFDKPVEETHSGIGDGMKNILLINAVAPVLFAYGKYKDDEVCCERAIQLLEAAKPESNSIINIWKGLGLNPVNAAETQALLQLKNNHCNKFDCLNCVIGHKILSKQKDVN